MSGSKLADLSKGLTKHNIMALKYLRESGQGAHIRDIGQHIALTDGEHHDWRNPNMSNQLGNDAIQTLKRRKLARPLYHPIRERRLHAITRGEYKLSRIGKAALRRILKREATS